MGSTVEGNIGDLASNPEEFLQRYYHHLTRCIRPQQFYSYLRSQQILTLDDQEVIENTYITTYLKAGCLIDVIIRKGKLGFIAFMEVVEYTYPDLFREITGRPARQPPKKFWPDGMQRSVMKQSSDVLNLMAQVTNTLTQEVVEKKHQLTELQKLVERMREERISEEEQRSSLCNDLEHAQDRIDQLTSDNAMIRRELKEAKEERDLERTRYNEMLLQKDKYVDQCTQLRFRCQNMGPKVEKLHAIERDRSFSRPSNEQQERLRAENYELKCELNLFKSQSEDSNSNISDNISIITKLKKKCADLQKKMEELSLEKSDFSIKNADLKSVCQGLQETNNHLDTAFEQCKNERDQYRKLYEEMEAKYNEEGTKNSNLTQECRQYMEQYREMAEMMENLNRELEKQREYHCIHSSWCLQRERSGAIDSTSTWIKKIQFPIKGMSERKSDPIICRNTDKDNPDVVPDKEKKSYKRNASYPLLGAAPLIVFMPKDVEPQLLQILREHFDSPPIDIIQSEDKMTEMINDLEILHYEDRMPEGYHCILTSKLQQLKKTVLMVLPVTCILRMNRASIRPIVAVINFKNKEGFYELSNEEEILERNDIECEPILVDNDFKTDLPKLVESILLPKLKQLIGQQG